MYSLENCINLRVSFREESQHFSSLPRGLKLFGLKLIFLSPRQRMPSAKPPWRWSQHPVLKGHGFSRAARKARFTRR
jgi:hypothetical protein